MHELAITQNIVDLVDERAGEARVRRLILEIGRLSAVMPDAVRFCFDLCSAGTALEGAALQITEPPGRGRCRRCGRELELDEPVGRCACGSCDIDCIAGEELSIKAMEIA